MENHSHTSDTPHSRRVLEAQLRECFGLTVYSHKTHEKCAYILLNHLAILKTGQIILSAVTTGGFIGAIFDKSPVVAIVGACASTVLLALNTYSKSLDLGALGQKHRRTASDLWLIREQYLSLITDLAMGEKPVEKLQTERDRLLTKLHAIYAAAPSTNGKAYEAAQKALQISEELTFCDAEIDAFLPAELRRASSVSASA
ncbi:SLATT domain-containing protein [Undibacterium sp. CY18W]|uniref:SLATT domain-containing protein n=1 Tax=Undibacterium hunanense TaxID=2762292 RepID=A0ABR6ZNE4_9BURK|nr:SLATT domain-containing protein [Undibacterium hunanense]MBC3917093.1 SLATT domain-containing protein [Undibacterium hunanense]